MTEPKHAIAWPLESFLGAISFLSIIPTGLNGKLTGRSIARTAGYFPASGLLIGAIGVAFLWAVSLAVDTQPASALVVLFLIVITGGLHIDALSDTVDGLLGKHTKEARLKIMRKGSSGPFGVAAVTAVLLIKYSAFDSLVGDMRYVSLLVVPALSRWPMVIMAWYLPAVRKSGLGHVFSTWIKKEDVYLASTLALGSIAILAGYFGLLYLWLIPPLALIVLAGIRTNSRLIGGVTGDTLGATVEISEAILLLAFSILSRS